MQNARAGADAGGSDGIHGMVPRERILSSARKLRDAYARKPDAPFFQREFGFYCLERWKEQGMPQDIPLETLFGYDPAAVHVLGGLGWCDPAFSPAFEVKVLEDRGDHELVQDAVGRHVLYFKGRRSGFMPEFVTHPVCDVKSWEEECQWRLDPSAAERFTGLEARMREAQQAAGKGLMMQQQVIGGYMYLRSLMGPVDLLYMMHDSPELIHRCMRAWLALADAIIARHQQYVTLDELYLGEDICYNHGPLISPEMMREYIVPYYRQLITNVKSRQLDRARHLYFQIDSDGFVEPVIPLYRELGMDVMGPFEAASGCDVIRTGRQYADLMLYGGVDKRELAKGTADIDRLVDRIFPVMRQRGGYIPTCDHGVPEEVSYANYCHFRKRCLEFAS